MADEQRGGEPGRVDGARQRDPAARQRAPDRHEVGDAEPGAPVLGGDERAGDAERDQPLERLRGQLVVAVPLGDGGEHFLGDEAFGGVGERGHRTSSAIRLHAFER